MFAVAHALALCVRCSQHGNAVRVASGKSCRRTKIHDAAAARQAFSFAVAACGVLAATALALFTLRTRTAEPAETSAAVEPDALTLTR
jgi:hypothetical protein